MKNDNQKGTPREYLNEGCEIIQCVLALLKALSNYSDSTHKKGFRKLLSLIEKELAAYSDCLNSFISASRESGIDVLPSNSRYSQDAESAIANIMFYSKAIKKFDWRIVDIYGAIGVYIELAEQLEDINDVTHLTLSKLEKIAA